MKNTLQTICLYHGGTSYVEEPNTWSSGISCDFGPGFYCTTQEAQAKERGKQKMTQEKKSFYAVSEYKLNADASLDIRYFEKPDAEWMEAVYKGRNGWLLEGDIIIGPVADSRIQALLDDLDQELKNTYISDFRKIKQVRKDIFAKYAQRACPSKFEKYDQVVFITERGLEKLNFIDGRRYDAKDRLVHTYRHGDILPKEKKTSKTKDKGGFVR